MPNEIKPRIVDGEPVCDRKCKHCWRAGIRYELGKPCGPGLRQQRDQALAKLDAVKGLACPEKCSRNCCSHQIFDAILPPKADPNG